MLAGVSLRHPPCDSGSQEYTAFTHNLRNGLSLMAGANDPNIQSVCRMVSMHIKVFVSGVARAVRSNKNISKERSIFSSNAIQQIQGSILKKHRMSLPTQEEETPAG